MTNKQALKMTNNRYSNLIIDYRERQSLRAKELTSDYWNLDILNLGEIE